MLTDTLLCLLIKNHGPWSSATLMAPVCEIIVADVLLCHGKGYKTRIVSKARHYLRAEPYRLEMISALLSQAPIISNQ